jgi:hypothetical protein
VHPATLFNSRRPDLTNRLPETERPVRDGKLRRLGKAAAAQIDEQCAPVVRALAQPVGEADQLFAPLRRCPDDDENALLCKRSIYPFFRRA